MTIGNYEIGYFNDAMNTNYYDLIGDIHGQYDKLVDLLNRLGYEAARKTFRHPDGRKVVFLGDYVDRGPRIRDTLHLVRGMVDAGDAVAIMGNHEFNAVAYATPDGEGGYLRQHKPNNVHQHAATLRDFAGKETEWTEWLNWFRRLPMFLDLGGVRAVHACWDERGLTLVQGTPLVEDDFLHLAARKGTVEHETVETILKGPELALPQGASFRDKENIPRHNVRTRWWNLRAGLTLGDITMPLPTEVALPLTQDHIDRLPQYHPEAAPVFFGHYWMPPTLPREPLGVNLVCLDYSAGLGPHPMTAYRWNGEALPLAENFVTGKEGV
jgi:hypothetical protein